MAVDPDSIRPTVAQVARRIRTRTRDADGVEQGTFTSSTRPTAVEAEDEIASASRLVALQLGRPYSTWDGDLLETAREVVAARAALEIERSFYGDGSSPDDTPLDQLGRRYAEDLAALQQTARDNQVGGRRMHSIRIVSAARRRPAADPDETP
ncbi:MAG: hypothetical protein M0P31_15435 [Solirubrobacteraceae bacterium]|nr:hypothetical protein [Solirubrobacteraceae bacterium]